MPRALIAEHPGIVAKVSAAERGVLAHEAWAANAPAVALMLELGFDPAVNSPNGGNALHCAAFMGSTECVAAILRHPAGRALLDVRDPRFGGAPLNWCSHGSRNTSPVGKDHAGVARLLIEAGASVDPSMAEWDVSDELHALIDDALRDRRR